MAILEVGLNLGKNNLMTISYNEPTSDFEKRIRKRFLTALEAFSDEDFDEEKFIVDIAGMKLVGFTEKIQEDTSGKDVQSLICYAIIDWNEEIKPVEKVLDAIRDYFIVRFPENVIISKGKYSLSRQFEETIYWLLKEFDYIISKKPKKILPYNDLTKAIKFRKDIFSALKADLNDPYAHANYGVVLVQNNEFEKALNEFNTALNIFSKQELGKEVKRIKDYIMVTEKTMTFLNRLGEWDKNFLSILKLTDINMLARRITKSTNEISKLLSTIINFKSQPEIIGTYIGINVENLALAKMECLSVLSDILNSRNVDISELSRAKSFFTKWELNDFIIAVNEIENLYYESLEYNSISEYFNKKNQDISITLSRASVFNGALTIRIKNSLLLDPIEFSYKLNGKERLPYTYAYDKEYCYKVCEEVANKIPIYKDKKYTQSDYIEFIDQFPEKYRNLIAKLLKNITYITFKEMVDLLVNEIKKISSDTLHYFVTFRAFLEKSSNAWTYFTKRLSGRKCTQLAPEEVIDRIKQVDNVQKTALIFLDDFIGTGNQFITTFREEFVNQIIELEDMISSKENVDIHLIAGVGTSASKENIFDNLRSPKHKTPLFKRNDIKYGKNLGEGDKAFDDKKWSNDEKDILDEFKNYLEEIDPKWWNGYKGSELLVVLEYYTPNNTIGCLWNDGIDWKALFPT